MAFRIPAQKNSAPLFDAAQAARIDRQIRGGVSMSQIRASVHLAPSTIWKRLQSFGYQLDYKPKQRPKPAECDNAPEPMQSPLFQDIEVIFQRPALEDQPDAPNGRVVWDLLRAGKSHQEIAVAMGWPRREIWRVAEVLDAQGPIEKNRQQIKLLESRGATVNIAPSSKPRAPKPPVEPPVEPPVYAKLTPGTTRQVIERVVGGDRQCDVARELGVNPKRIGNVISRYRRGQISWLKPGDQDGNDLL